MKRKILGFILAVALVAAFLPLTASPAAADTNAYTPQNLTASLLAVDETHPKGSVLLTFTIAELPRDDATSHWQVAIEKKIGTNNWTGVSSENTSNYLDTYAKSGGVYQYEQLWNEGFDWDGTIAISYRVYVVLYDETWSMTAQSAFSNVATVGLQVSSWAAQEVQQAVDDGLVPDSLKTEDLTLPITREEFCELAILLYVKSTDTTVAPASPNPFTDTSNPDILKAFAIGITTGTTTTTFSPNDLVTREQCATMLFRAIQKIVPDADYSIAGIPNFPDQKDIASWAVTATKYMSNLGIIKGDAKGNFMPKATPNAGQASSYGQATREQAILMSVRTYNKIA